MNPQQVNYPGTAQTPFTAYTTATPPALAFSPPPGASPAPAAPTPRPPVQRYSSPAATLPPPPRSRAAPSTLGTGRGGTGTGGVAAALEDPVVEARKTLALIAGIDGKSGVIGELEKGFEAVFKRWECAFDEDGGGPAAEGPSLDSLLATLATLVQTLRSSPIGGYPIVQPTGSITQEIEINAMHAQKLFRERQKGKEGSEVARSVLAS